MHAPVTKRIIGLTDLAHQIAVEQTEETGCSSLSEYLEWLILCQKFPTNEAAEKLKERRQRGGRKSY